MSAILVHPSSNIYNHHHNHYQPNLPPVLYKSILLQLLFKTKSNLLDQCILPIKDQANCCLLPIHQHCQLCLHSVCSAKLTYDEVHNYYLSHHKWQVHQILWSGDTCTLDSNSCFALIFLCAKVWALNFPMATLLIALKTEALFLKFCHSCCHHFVSLHCNAIAATSACITYNAVYP